MNTLRIITAALALGLAAGAGAQTTELVLKTAKPGAEVQPTMYGIFFEDINYAADGGLYAEKVKNRSFEFPQNLMGWRTFGSVELRDDGPFDRNPHYVRLSAAPHPHKHTGLDNEGYFGVSVEQGQQYRFSVWARTPDGGSAALQVQLVETNHADDRQALAEQTLTVASPEWRRYELVLTPDATASDARLRIFLAKPETTVDLEHISLFPVDTWKGRPGGLRRDLAQKLSDLRPGIFRFPGGCIVEGTELATRYNWKNTVGPVENRPLNENRWHYTFTHRFFPDYYQSGGLGFYEYFLLSEDIGAEPLPIVSVGLACQFQNDDMSAHVPVDSLAPYIQDALDLVEFANGDTSTRWGALRAEMGHPEPFGLKYIGIGNEQWGPEYPERLEPFVQAMRREHPEIKIVGSAGPYAGGEFFDYLWPEMRRLGADLVDEHYYAPESWFLANADRYDSYPRKGPKVFAGEYACHGVGKKLNHFNASLLEAAFMTGLERNADLVHMATYAPLLAHVDGWQWRPDMIWYDNLRSYPTCSYYVQQLYSLNKGTRVLPLLTTDGRPLAGKEGQQNLYGSAVLDGVTGEYVVKLVNVGDTPRTVHLTFDGLKKGEGITAMTITSLHADPNAENSLDRPDRVKPLSEEYDLDHVRRLSTVVPARTFRVYRFSK